MQVCRTFLAIGYTVTAVKEPMAVVGMWEKNGISWVREGAYWKWTIRARWTRNCGSCRFRCCRSGWWSIYNTTSVIWIITYFQIHVPMQVCWTFFAVCYTVTAMKEPMAVVGMWEENGKR
jgi:hypothetical protein